MALKPTPTSSSDTNLTTCFATGFPEDNEHRFGRLSKTIPENIDTLPLMVSLLQGLPGYTANINWMSLSSASDSVNPKLNLAAYVDINSLELGRTSFRNDPPNYQRC